MDRLGITRLREIADALGIPNVESYRNADKNLLIELIEKYQDYSDDETIDEPIPDAEILNLPNELLDEIIQKLSVEDRINFLFAYPQLKNFAKYWIEGPILLGDLMDLEEKLQITDIPNFSRVEVITGPLDRIPEEYLNLKQPRFIDLGNQKVSPKIKNLIIYEIPKNLRFLQHLESLTIDDPKLTQIPNEVFELRNLQILNIINASKIRHLPNEIAHLKNLKKLDLYGMGINRLPKNFVLLENLQSLVLQNTKFTHFPEELLQLPKLVYVNLRSTQVEYDIPKSVKKRIHIELSYYVTPYYYRESYEM